MFGYFTFDGVVVTKLDATKAVAHTFPLYETEFVFGTMTAINAIKLFNIVKCAQHEDVVCVG